MRPFSGESKRVRLSPFNRKSDENMWNADSVKAAEKTNETAGIAEYKS